jgi:hypothetical protein
MKKLSILLISIFVAFNINAGSIAKFTIVNTGSKTGGFNAMLTMIGKTLNHSYVQAGNPMVAASYFNKVNVITTWSTEWPGDNSLPKVKVGKNNIVALTVYETTLCSRKFNSLDAFSGKTIKIGTWGESTGVSGFISSLGKKLNAKFIIVPYSGSGDIARGFLGGDIDTVFITQSKQQKIEKDGKCIAFSSKGELDFAWIDAILLINGESGTEIEARKAMLYAINTQEWQTAQAGVATYVPNGTNDELVLNKYNMAVKFNSN